MSAFGVSADIFGGRKSLKSATSVRSFSSVADTFFYLTRDAEGSWPAIVFKVKFLRGVFVSGGLMSAILIRCPVAGVAVQTGLSTETIVFRSLPNISYSLRCPRCKKLHRWRPKDAWVEKLKLDKPRATSDARHQV